ncbi:MAG: hypothetical protein MK085_10965, partial [Phycisphaerales bacterium]|nr:hypothetical protein [Phycisphaerales bacterium]
LQLHGTGQLLESIQERGLIPAQDLQEITNKAMNAMQQAEATIQAGEDVISRVQLIAPETQGAFRKIYARSSLAGGQLRLLMDSILSTGITAITYRPNHDSLSRRQLLESVDNTLFAVQSLQQAARSLESIAMRNPDAIRSNPRLAELLAEPMEDQILQLNNRLQALYDLMVRIAP